MSGLVAPNNSRDTDLSLDHLAIRINDSHRMCEASVRAGLDHAIKCGQALIKAKRRVGHGRWLDWLEASCPGLSPRQAQGYMRLARNLPALEANTKPVSHLGVRETLALLAEPKTNAFNWPTGPLPDAGHQLAGATGDGRLVELTAAENPDFVHAAVSDPIGGTTDHTIRCVKRSAVHLHVAVFLGLHEDDYDSAEIQWGAQEECNVWPGIYFEGYIPEWKHRGGAESAGIEQAAMPVAVPE